MEVKGAIKLGCKTVTGKPFVVCRTFQVTQKKGGKYEFKALDQTIRTAGEDGEVRGEREGRAPRLADARWQQAALSKKCADVNVEVPLLMGVSKAILESVIFVHQDDSNWCAAGGTGERRPRAYPLAQAAGGGRGAQETLRRHLRRH